MNDRSRRPFGTTPKGEPVELLTLDNGRLSCQLLTFGAAIRALRVAGRDGKTADVVLGYDTLEEYMTRDGYFGATVGRCANRIAAGRFSLNGKCHTLAVNNGPNHLHGGLTGFSHRVWTVAECAAARAVLTLDSPDGEEGYPGRLRLSASFSLEGDGLTIRYQGMSDKDTVCNLTNHSYFNLGGHSSGPVLGQELRLFASRYTPTDDTGIPLGRLDPVAGTAMDLRCAVPIGAHLHDPFPQLVQAGGYDHNYVLDGSAGTLRPAAEARCGGTGISMAVSTTLPGVQLYTANFLDEGRPGKGGARYGPYHAFCLETQFFPDSPNQPQFPSAVLRAGETYDHTTRFVFSVDK